MRNAPFLLFSLGLFSAYACGRFYFQSQVRLDSRAWEARIESLERAAAEERLRAVLAQHELADWRQHVAVLVPEALENTRSEAEAYPLRNIASVAAGDVEPKLQVELAGSLFERAKEAFRSKRYAEAAEGFERLIEAYPASRYGVEARFLLAESSYQQKDYSSAVDAIESLIGHFPESELAGFALLRLGDVFEKQDRKEDATEIYRAILKTYSNPDLLAQARVALKGAEP